MRTITYGGANSLDNFIARTDGGVDWLMWCDEAAEYMRDYWAKIDTILMGRKTYEVAMKNAGGGGGSFPGISSYVFSRTLPPGKLGDATVVADAVPFVRELKAAPGKDICLMGGGELARPLLEAGLVVQIGFNIHPVLLGSGIPAYLPMNRQINLELKECRVFHNGCVLVTYRVKT
jgi:dihydrofolate reductase